MAYDPNNVFAKILRGEIPSVAVYEDANTLAFMDAMPQADGHTLVIPKENAQTIFELSEGGAANLIAVTIRIARAVRIGMGAEGITLTQFNGAAAGQSVLHVHFHILPRWSGTMLRRHGGSMEDPEKLKSVAEKIKAALSKEDT